MRDRPSPGRQPPVTVRPVSGGADRRAFLALPGQIHRGDPAWVAPLRLERRLHCSRLNPFFEHGRWQSWVAWRGDEPVGRIAAHVDELHRARYGPDTGHFGLLDAGDDDAVFAALMGAAEDWLAGEGTRRVSGPFNFSINQECGLLVDGFEHPPVVMMPHNGPWYGRQLERLGYAPVRDLLAYWVNVDFVVPRVMQALIDRFGPRVRLRPLNRRRLRAELELLRDIFNDAWSGNWGFVPFTRAEFAELGSALRLFVRDELVQIAEVEGEAVAFIVALPNLNEALRDLDGRLFPLGWWHLLRRLKGGRVHTGRVPLMGVRRRFQNRPLGMALAYLVIGAVRRELLAQGITHVEMSWILEDNSGMRSILDSIGSSLYKRYRIYEKRLEPAAP